MGPISLLSNTFAVNPGTIFDIVNLLNHVQVFKVPSKSFPTLQQQVAAHLREELAKGRWTGTMPGRTQLINELDVSGRTIEIALQQLEKEGLIASQGAGRRRLILDRAHKQDVRKLRIAMLLPDRRDQSDEFLIEIRHKVEEAGYLPFLTEKSMTDFGMETEAIVRYVEKQDADLWIVLAGPRELLEWFSEWDKPAFALFGRRREITIASAGPDKTGATLEATRRLLDLGHRRITLLCREARRIPAPGKVEQTFLNELAEAGVPIGQFNLPDWSETKQGFISLLESLFGPTPPTAIIADEPFLFNAVFYFVTNRGLRVPEDISLICTDSHPSFAWCEPSVAHIHWDIQPVIRRLLRWLKNVQSGRSDRRSYFTKARFIEGGTIGPKRPSS